MRRNGLGPWPTRLLITCTGPGSDARDLGENGGSSVAGGSERLAAANRPVGRMPVLRKPHSGLMQPARIDGNAGRLDAEVGSFSAMNGLSVLPWPPAAAPVVVELVIVPTGKLESGIDPVGKLMNLGIGSREAADRAVGASAGGAGRRGAVDAAEVRADEAANDVVVVVPHDRCERRRAARIVPRFTPANPPR